MKTPEQHIQRIKTDYNLTSLQANIVWDLFSNIPESKVPNTFRQTLSDNQIGSLDGVEETAVQWVQSNVNSNLNLPPKE